MKKFLIVLLCLISLAGCKKANVNEPVTPANPSETHTIKTIQEGELTIYNIDDLGITIVKIPRISSYIYQKATTKNIEELAVDSSFTLLVNASYFDRGVNGCTHSGYLKINGSKIENTIKDRQLNRLFAYDSKNNIVKNYAVEDIDSTTAFDLAFQTGPQIILNGKIDSASIDESINGNEYKIRTAFATVDNKNFYVIIDRHEITLKELGRLLLTFNIFKGTVNVINFDGGPSTALYVKNQPNTSYSVTSHLPLFIGVK
jgi:exopolysaccharide biosynthesis protein